MAVCSKPAISWLQKPKPQWLRLSPERRDSAMLGKVGNDAFGRYVNVSHSSSDPVPRLITFRILKGYNDEGRYYQFDPNKFGSEDAFADATLISTSDSTDTYFFN